VPHEYTANIAWQKGAGTFTDGRYSRAPRWHFDGGAMIAASASPGIVPLPYSDPAAVDPEEALIAAAASCHMLWFLSLAAQRGYDVRAYRDRASGCLEPNERGKLAFRRIVLRPQVEFSGVAPDAAQLQALHHAAHEECFIAQSLRTEIVVETAG
jgi:organic hydroperoxide reductase OsmC/OhrA